MQKCAQMLNKSMQKLLCNNTQMQQLFGGYGFMEEYPIARSFANARVQQSSTKKKFLENVSRMFWKFLKKMLKSF